MNIYQKSINTARVISATAISNVGSGHTGVCLGAAPILFTLFKDHLMFNPAHSNFENRDRFVLSAGHAAPLYYTMLHMFGFNVLMNDLKNLRKLGSKTPGHPELGATDGVEVSTGPLGQGVANAVGLAIAQRYQGKKFNTINMSLFDNHTYCFVGDGCLMEGVAQEAVSLAGTLGLDKLILLYDSNNITIDGSVEVANKEVVKAKFEAMNWNVFVCDGNNHHAISKMISKAKLSKGKPSIIICSTKIGYGCELEGSNKIHGTALKNEEIQKLKNKLMIDNNDFEIDEDVKVFCSQTITKNAKKYDEWQENFFLFEKTYPELFKVYQQFVSPKRIDFSKFNKSITFGEEPSGRDANKLILTEIANRNSNIIGGTADLGPSVKAEIEGSSYFSSDNFAGRNIHYGIREHAMSAITNGIALYSSLMAFDGTFLSFSNYMIPAIRMAALMELPVLHFFSHDGLKVGEDGPTHQPVEQITQLRAIPNTNIFRPADETELLACYDTAFTSSSPNCFVLTKGSMPKIPSNFIGAKKGAYVVENDGTKIDVVIMASGAEVALAMQVKKMLNEKGVKVQVSSFPCIEQFEKQNALYKKTVLGNGTKTKIAIECSNDSIWWKYVGVTGIVVGNDKFGRSGKGKQVYEKYGFNSKDVLRKIMENLQKN